jgi:DNA-binding NarL/FixJ family response regulator
MTKITVLLVDDHALFRQGIRALLANSEYAEIIGEATDGREAVEKVRDLQPQVVLMDIGMPGMGGIEATRRIVKEDPVVKVLVLTQYDDIEYILSMLRLGAKGYIAKTATAEELETAIQAVRRGESYLYPSAATALVEAYLHRTGGEQDVYERLTNREKEVLQLVAEGRTNREIAEQLFISVKTVLRHRTNIMEKLGFHNRTELIKYAISKGLIEIPRRIENQ